LRVESLGDLIVIYDRELALVERWLRRDLKDHAGYRTIQVLHGVDPIGAAPYWQLRFDEVTGVEWVTNWLMLGSGGVRSWVSDGDYRIFWTSRWGEILGGLGQLGVPVDLERHTFHPFDPWL